MGPTSSIGNLGLILYECGSLKSESNNCRLVGYWSLWKPSVLFGSWSPFGIAIRGGNEVGVEARRASLCSRLVPRCSWAPAQMQLEDRDAAKKSRAPCCSLAVWKSQLGVRVYACMCIFCVCKRERERQTKWQNVNEKSFLRRVQATWENVHKGTDSDFLLGTSVFEMLPRWFSCPARLENCCSRPCALALPHLLLCLTYCTVMLHHQLSCLQHPL